MHVLHVRAEAFGVSIEPLTAAHAEPLSRATCESDFRYFTRTPKPFDPEGWRAFIQERNGPGSFAHALVVRGELAGMSTVFDISSEHRKLEIGFTMIFAPFRGTCVNAASKWLLMREAFETWGALRVQLKADAKNQHSVRAMTDNGFHCEGTLRNFQLLPGGYERDVSFFSVVHREWHETKARLASRCASRGYPEASSTSRSAST